MEFFPLNCTDVIRRSMLGMVFSYNALPQSIVDVPILKVFQRHLQNAVLSYAHWAPDSDWAHFLKTGMCGGNFRWFQEFFVI